MLRFGEQNTEQKLLKITIPEDLDYEGVFEDLFARYTKHAQLVKMKTSNMGTLYELHYHIIAVSDTGAAVTGDMGGMGGGRGDRQKP